MKITNVLKAFLRIDELVENQPNAQSALGEISTYSLTFTKDRGEYTNSATPGYGLISISNRDVDGAKVVVSEEIATHTLDLLEQTYLFAKEKGYTVTLNQYRGFLLTLDDRASDFKLGRLTEGKYVKMPQWIEWQYLDNDTQTTGYIKIWLADLAFREQFDEHEHVVVKPIGNLEDFFLPPNPVAAKLKEITPAVMMDLIQNAKLHNPETVTRLTSYNYAPVNYPGIVIPVYWGSLIYGAAGDNVDAIKDSIIDYLLENSTHNREDWATVFPDLFKRNEFIIVPRWDKVAIPNMSQYVGEYSPMSNGKEALGVMVDQFNTALDESFITDNLTIFTHPYKSLTLLCIGSPDNRQGNIRVEQVYKDYVNVGTQNPDYGRMSQATQDWSIGIEEMLFAAETCGDFGAIPTTVRRVKRNGIGYLSRVFQDIQYLVQIKILPDE